MQPAATIAKNSSAIRFCGPTNAPSAPTNFQSPAPRLRMSTNGSSNPRPRQAPRTEAFAPGQPRIRALIAMPKINPETVSQLGIRRLRQSMTPATAAKSKKKAQNPYLTMPIGFASAILGGLSHSCRSKSTRSRNASEQTKRPGAKTGPLDLTRTTGSSVARWFFRLRSAWRFPPAPSLEEVVPIPSPLQDQSPPLPSNLLPGQKRRRRSRS